jgi:hypothetical protein
MLSNVGTTDGGANGGGCAKPSSSYTTPFSVEPFFQYASTINTTATIVGVDRATVWPVVKAMNDWSTFQDIFNVDFVGGGGDSGGGKDETDDTDGNDDNGMVQVGQKIRIATAFPVGPPQVTLEQYNEIVEENRICWTVRALELLPGILTVPAPHSVLRTERCIELFDDHDNNGNAIIHNWISYAGVAWPAVCLLTGAIVEGLFHDFNDELTREFV